MTCSVCIDQVRKNCSQPADAGIRMPELKSDSTRSVIPLHDAMGRGDIGWSNPTLDSEALGVRARIKRSGRRDADITARAIEAESPARFSWRKGHSTLQNSVILIDPVACVSLRRPPGH